MKTLLSGFIILISTLAVAQENCELAKFAVLNKTADQHQYAELQFRINRLQGSSGPVEIGNVTGSGGNVSGGGNRRIGFKGSTEEMQCLKKFQADQLGASQLHKNKFTGKNFRAVIVDSGLNPESAAAKNVFHFQDFTGSCSTPNTMCDPSGHGTLVADLLLQTAPEASLIILKTLLDDSKGDFAHLTKALKWILSNHKKFNIKVANLSLVSPDRVYGYINEVDEARVLIKKIAEAGVLIVSAVGNEYEKKEVKLFPASSVEVIAVGSYSHQFSTDKFARVLSPFSNVGFAIQPVTQFSKFLGYPNSTKIFSRSSFKPEIFAPGENVLACNVDCQFVSGSSYAAALTAGGLLSLLDQTPDLTRETLLQKQSAHCEPPSLTNQWDRNVSCAVRLD